MFDRLFHGLMSKWFGVFNSCPLQTKQLLIQRPPQTSGHQSFTQKKGPLALSPFHFVSFMFFKVKSICFGWYFSSSGYPMAAEGQWRPCVFEEWRSVMSCGWSVSDRLLWKQPLFSYHMVLPASRRGFSHELLVKGSSSSYQQSWGTRSHSHMCILPKGVGDVASPHS